jgi:hypothetical protein
MKRKGMRREQEVIGIRLKGIWGISRVFDAISQDFMGKRWKIEMICRILRVFNETLRDV